MSEVKENGEMIISVFRRRYSESGEKSIEGIDLAEGASELVFHAQYTPEGIRKRLLLALTSDQ